MPVYSLKGADLHNNDDCTDPWDTVSFRQRIISLCNRQCMQKWNGRQCQPIDVKFTLS